MAGNGADVVGREGGEASGGGGGGGGGGDTFNILVGASRCCVCAARVAKSHAPRQKRTRNCDCWNAHTHGG